ncbi:MAG: ankyrin repeat domain-containing protein [Acidobacteria bacterium]|nr:ankyrin repeat domain-containing protein [Acidobacteriota bacterium]
MPRNTTNSILDRINISSPCSADWDSMIGNREVRFCLHCSKHVNNLSEMTRKQALELVARSKGQLCVRYYRRPDGRVETAGPDSQLYQIKRRATRLAAGAFSAALGLCSSVAAQTPSPVEQPASCSLEMKSVYNNASPAIIDGADAIISGTVTDPNEAVVAGAGVTLINESNAQEQLTTTNDEGRYYFKSLDAGTYTLKVTSPGFAEHESRGIVVPAGASPSIDVSAVMQPGAIMGGAMVIITANEPLVVAALENDLAAVKELIAAGVDINLRDKGTDTTALDEAVKNGNRQMVRALLDAGAEINARNSRGQTALMILDDDASENLVWDLVAAGAKLNLRDEDGDTALILAASWSKAEILRALLNAGGRVNAKNKEGETALMKAAAEGNLESVKLLIDSGAEINRKNSSGATALKLAEGNEHQDVVEQLEAYSASK